MRGARYVTAIAAVFLLAAAPWLYAVWVADGIGISTTPEEQWEPRILADESGGAIVVWRHDVAGLGDLYAQRIDEYGTFQWDPNGVPLATDSPSEWGPVVVPYDSGAVVVFLCCSPSVDVHAQKIDWAGNVHWQTSGVPVCTAWSVQERQCAVPDGADGVFVSWSDYRTYQRGPYLQRIAADGSPLWDVDGIRATSTFSWDPQIIGDGAGGAIIAWIDGRDYVEPDIYAQRFDADGDTLWALDGVVVDTTSTEQAAIRMSTDGSGGAIVVYMNVPDIKAQRLDDMGNRLWGQGVDVCTAAGQQDWVRVAPDAAGGAFIVWHDPRGSDGDIYAQWLDSGGNAQWTTDGIGICTAANDQYTPEIAPDGSGGLFICWTDERGSDPDIYAQWVDSTGTAQWQTDGVAVCTLTGTQQSPVVTATTSGRAIVAWQDYRSGNPDIYAQSLVADGSFGPIRTSAHITGVSDVPNDQGGKLQLQWGASHLDIAPNTTITHYSVWRRLDAIPETVYASDGTSLPTPVDFDGKAIRTTANGYAWEWLNNTPARYFDTYAATVVSLYDSTGTDTGWQYFMVSAQTDTPWVYYDSEVDSGYSVDNLSPAAPQGLAAEQMSVDGPGLRITWLQNTEPDCGGYAVYRGTSDSFVPGPVNRIASPVEPLWEDNQWSWQSGYYYKVTAVDVHGNESPVSVLGPDLITGTGMPGVPKIDYLAQNHPNPFNPSTGIEFGIKESAHVSLRVYDATGRLVRVLVDERREAKTYHETWDGRDDKGRAVASGVYFCRLVIGQKTMSHKMVLLK